MGRYMYTLLLPNEHFMTIFDNFSNIVSLAVVPGMCFFNETVSLNIFPNSYYCFVCELS